MRKALGFMPGLIAIMACTVVLYLLARFQMVSPALMVYANEPAGQVVGGVVPGMHILWPTTKALGFMPGLIAIMAFTVVLNLAARPQIVSPAITV